MSARQRREAVAAGDARLERELRLVVGDEVAVPPLWVLRAWVEIHAERCDTPWAWCLDDVLDVAEGQGQRPVGYTDLPALEDLAAPVRWAARRARSSVLAARPWRGEQRTAWHEAGHALVAFQDQHRYDPLVVDLTRHLGGFDEAGFALSPLVVPTSPAVGLARGGPGVQPPAGGAVGWSEEQKATYRVWLSAGMAAEQVFVPEQVPTGDAPPYGRQYPGQCNVLHLDDAMLRVTESAQQVRALAGYLLAHSGASRRHLRRMLSGWAALESWIAS